MNADEILVLAKIIEWFEDKPKFSIYDQGDNIGFVKVTANYSTYYIYADESGNVKVSDIEPEV